MIYQYEDFKQAYSALLRDLSVAPDIHVGEWQAIRKDDMPQADTIELEDVSFQVPLPMRVGDWQTDVKPNLPWAEDHFLERISGIPYNPPPSSSYWPFAQKDNEEHKAAGIFSHTYPERFWPKFANQLPLTEYPWMGIRYPYGDLGDVIKLLTTSPGTRQRRCVHGRSIRTVGCQSSWGGN
jgi:hypothetical protein